jgi:hypothetical protein
LILLARQKLLGRTARSTSKPRKAIGRKDLLNVAAADTASMRINGYVFICF